MGFFSNLEERARELNSLICVGLDPHMEDLSPAEPKTAKEFCLRLIDGTADLTLAYKPNIAFFEIFGPEGIAALQAVISEIPDGIPVILDAKRGDIASSARAYAQAAFETLGANAITVNPFLGLDSIMPFLKNEDKGVFLLCKTSNKGAADIQDLIITQDAEAITPGKGIKVYELIARKAIEWNEFDNLGLVVGSTQIVALQRVREMAPNLWFLAPGVGAQGADLDAALQAGLRRDGLGMIIPVSRGISRQADPRLAAQEISKSINRARNQIIKRVGINFQEQEQKDNSLKQLAIYLLESGCVKFGKFKLKSGLESPIYIDLRQLVGMPGLLTQVAESYRPILEDLGFDRLAALPYAGLPIATAISLSGGYPLVYPRKETKAYGTQAEIEGIFSPGEKVVLIDDLATTGGSKFEAIEKLNSVGLLVKDVVVLIDRQSGAVEDLAEAGYQLHAIFTLTQLLEHWKTEGLITEVQVTDVQKFISSSRENSSP